MKGVLYHAWLMMLIAFALELLSGCSAHSFFYYPNRTLYADPGELGHTYEIKTYPSLNGNKLSAILFKTRQTPKGIIVHFHGNFGNLSNHFMQSHFLTEYGFDVLVFDYQGYGASEGRPTPEGTVEDGIATVRLAQTLLRSKNEGIVVFGQSLGGAVAIVVTAQEPQVKAALIESGFHSYRSMARAALKQSVPTWILYPVFPLFLDSTYDPIRYVDRISPRPIFFIHGDQDRTVPVEMSRILFEKAKAPKHILIVPGADHLLCRRIGGKAYEAEVAGFFTAALAHP